MNRTGDGRDGRRAMAALCAIFALLAAPATVAPAQAQPSPAAATAPEATRSLPATGGCALHVWPAATTHTTFQGWTHAGAVDGARRGIKGYPDLHAEALDTAQQVRLLTTIDWRGLTGDPALAVTVHAAPTGSDDDRGRAARLVADSPACYREIIVTSSLVEAAAFSSRSIRILVLRKTFEGAGAPANFSSMAQAVIALPEKAADDDPRIPAAMQDAFLVAARKFAVMQSFH
ncbi:MAG: hypothetical protein KGN34_03960 [Sphingomonadales bacterium]|nr:hypothetical protein [Sphingomonadales bacterium]